MGIFSALNLRGCPNLKTPPKEIVSRGFNAVFGYLKRLLMGSVECKRTKLMMVGLGGAGKTSLVKYLTGGRRSNYYYGYRSVENSKVQWKISRCTVENTILLTNFLEMWAIYFELDNKEPFNKIKYYIILYPV